MSAARDPEKLKQKLLAFARDFEFFLLIGFEVNDLGPGWAHCQIQSRQQLENPNGMMHGGVIATLIDASITQALLMTEPYQAIRDTRGTLSTIDLHVKYLRPARHGLIRCEARVVHLGRRVVHAQATVRDEENKELAIGDASLMLVLGDQT
jgi:uncharacterized protein (TIGR00369 family)